MESRVQPNFDISLVINIHCGRPYLARTMRSFEDAVRFAHSFGLTIEAVFVLDRSDPATLEWVQDYNAGVFDDVQIVRVDHASLGLSRDYGLRIARGHYVMFGDEDDLISFNLIAESYRLAEAEGPRCIVIPEYLFGFGLKNFVTKYFGSEQVSPFSFMRYHPFVSRLFIHNSVKNYAQFIDVQLSSGYAYEDWHFNATVYSLGYIYRTAPDTVLFYRHRSGLLRSMDTISTRLVPPTRLFQPQIYMHVCENAEFLPGSVPNKLDIEEFRKSFFENSLFRELVTSAHVIEPTINMEKAQAVPFLTNTMGDLALGEAYLQACEAIGGSRFTDVVFLAPTLCERDVEHMANVFNTLRKANPDIAVLVLDPATIEDRYRLGARIPEAATLHLGMLHRGLEPDDFDIIALRVIESTAPIVRLHFLPGEFSQRFFGKFRGVLKKYHKYFYRFKEIDKCVAGSGFHRGGIFEFISDFLEDLDGVIACSERDIQFDRWRIDRSPQKWQLLRRYRPPDSGALKGPGSQIKRRLLIWGAGALGDDPDFVFALFQELWRTDRSIEFDIVADEKTHSFGEHLISTRGNVRMATPIDWSRGTEQLSHDAIIAAFEDAELFDSDFDASLFAIPTILLRRVCDMSPRTREIEAGLVVEGPQQNEIAVVAAAATVLKLYKEPELLVRLSRSALARSIDRHGSQSFNTAVRRIFEGR